MIVILKIERKRKPPLVGHVTFPFECEYPDIPAIEAALMSGKLIAGYQIVYEKIDDKVSVIRERRRATFSNDEVRSLQMPFQRFEEPA